MMDTKRMWIVLATSIYLLTAIGITPTSASSTNSFTESDVLNDTRDSAHTCQTRKLIHQYAMLH
jgi:hypothetical protein